MKDALRGAPTERLLSSLQRAFLTLGYEQPTMEELARACDITRRTLYNHFDNKEGAFRAQLRWTHSIEIAAGLAAGARVVADGGSALDAVVAIMDTRYGDARRKLESSPHAVEINYVAFRSFRDVMADSAATFQDRLVMFLTELRQRGLLRLRPEVTPAELAQLLADGARGVNQTLPPQPALSLPERYRRMFAVILHGCSEL
jgi:AcrR family transcriptional regulator